MALKEVQGLNREGGVQAWNNTLPSSNFLIARSAAAAAVILGNLAALAYIGWKFYPAIARLNEVKLINTLLWPSIIISFGAWRIWTKGKDAPLGLNERTARLYEGAQVLLMLPAALLLFPTYLASRVGRTNYRNWTTITRISRELRTQEFEDIAPHYQRDRHALDRFIDKYQRTHTNLFHNFIRMDARVPSFEQATVLMGDNQAKIMTLVQSAENTMTVKEWMDKAFPLMMKLKRELKKHQAKAGENPSVAAQAKTDLLKHSIRLLNMQWKKYLAPLCYNADRFVEGHNDGETLMQSIFLRSTGGIKLGEDHKPIAPSPIPLEPIPDDAQEYTWV